MSRQKILDLSKRDELEAEIERRRLESARAAAADALADEGIIFGGDFNMPEESRIYREDWSHLRNAFSRAGWGFGASVRVRRGSYEFSSRIDHILFGSRWRCSRCWVGPDVGSDHLPLIADLHRADSAE